jgi:hypothetical protein
MAGPGPVGETLGDRIRARRDARFGQPMRAALTEDVSDELRAYVDEQLAAIHKRLDALEKKKPRK